MKRLAGLVAVLLLAGCGGGGGSDSVSTTKAPAASTTQVELTPTTLDADVVLRRYASELGPVFEDVPDLSDNLSNCVIDKLTDYAGCESVWDLYVLTAGTVAETIPIKFKSLADDVGVPDELEKLILETKTDADMLGDGAKAYRDAGCTWKTESMECANLTSKIMGPLGFLANDVGNWKPYL